MKRSIKVNIIILAGLFAGFNIFAQKATVYTTAKNTNLRISKTGVLNFQDSKQPLEVQICVFVDSQRKFQTLLGIGSALTDASAETFYKLPENIQKEFLTAFYDKEKGIGYSLARTSINSCDFSSESYTYVSDNDSTLKSFNILPDKKYRIPFIQKAIAASGGSLPIIISPWSPPAWMKDNNDMLHGGYLLPTYYQSWANYFVKFIRSYEAENIPIFGLTVQNEPMAKQIWESCIFTSKQECEFLKNYLGPTLAKSGLEDKKIIIWDHNRDLIYQRVNEVLSDPMANKYAWGIGFHWYETWTGSDMMFDNVRKVHESFSNKHLIFTEGCAEKFKISKVNDWSLGEKYGYSMINDFNSGVEGWLDWNILLDETGGPNHVGNFCFAPVIADTKQGKLIYTNSYYYLGHFSKFIRPGAQRITSSSNRGDLLTTAFKNQDNKIVVIVMNKSDLVMNCNLFIDSKETKLESLPHSISTIIVE